MSRIEQLINEIEEYIDSCKFQPLSTTKIIVNKEELDELLVELRLRIPDEIKQYQKIISNQDAILSDAHSKADAMLAEATAQTNELVNEHEIMQRAYAQANEIIEQAQAQAQTIVDNAVADANGVRQGSIQYTDDMLKSLQTIMNHTMEGAQGRFDAFMNSMKSSYDIVSSNRKELSSGIITEKEEDAAPETEGKNAYGNKTNLKYGKTQNTGEDCHDGSCQGGVGNFPEKILPDGESGSFFVHRILPAAAGDRPAGGSR